MIPLLLDYASPSALESRRQQADLNLAANRRRPVRFHGRVVQDVFTLRIALRALGEAIWSSDSWLSSGDAWVLDPVITVHPDRLFFEAFSQDQSAYVQLQVDPALFETEGAVETGTTNVDFSAWLWGALGEMRSSRQTWLRIEAAGLEVETAGAGGRYEQKVDLPDAWVRGFLQLQSAMALPGTRLGLRPVDLLAAIRYLRHAKAKVSPRALRYEMEPGQDARLVLEPWEEAIALKGAVHSYAQQRVIRTWGRRRLRLLEPLLPFADRVEVYLKGRALPSFYVVHLPGMRFLLGLSGWGGQSWSDGTGFDLLATEAPPVEQADLERAVELLAQRHVLSASELADELGWARQSEGREPGLARAGRLFQRLCRDGRAIYDLEARNYRHRELFDTPPDEARLFPPDPRTEAVAVLLANQAVAVERCEPEEQRKQKRYKNPNTGEDVIREVVYRQWRVTGSARDPDGVTQSPQCVVNDEGRIIFGLCSCAFFKDNLLNRGPCAHIAALYRASDGLRLDLPVSRPGPERPPRGQAGEGDDGDDDGEDADDVRE